jgi:hypothetical protein
MSELHVFKSECDWYVAESLDEAWTMLVAQMGEPREELEKFDDIAQLPDDKPIRILCEQDAHGVLRPSDSGEDVTRTAAEWAAQEGRGMLCSSEY